MQKQTIFMLGLMLILVTTLIGTTSVLAQDLTCTECHDDTTLITGKQTGLSEAVHGTGEAYVRGTRSSCAGCHSGGAYSAMVAQGLSPDEVEVGDPNPTRQDCRTCHQIHTSYSAADWALETTAPVSLYAFEETTFNGGMGNLCANCHQPRRTIDSYLPDPNGYVNVSSTHWGPHHGPQSAVIIGKGGAGEVEGNPGGHAFLVRNTCVTCHIGENASHTFEAVEEACLECHEEDFDLDDEQAEIEALILQLRDLLLDRGLLSAETEYEINDEGVIEAVVVGYHPVVGSYPAAEAYALWNYILIAIEDGSLGVHNRNFIEDLLEASIASLQ